MIIELDDGRWVAIEIKSAADEIEEEVESLLNLKKKIDPNKKGKLLFLMMLY